jgi:hypothetical protein
LRNLDELRRTGAEDMLVGLLLTTAGRHVRADLAFLDDIEESLLTEDAAGLAQLSAQIRSRRPARTPGPGDGIDAVA